MDDFDYYGSNLPANNGDHEGTPEYEDFSETIEQAEKLAAKCKLIREENWRRRGF